MRAKSTKLKNSWVTFFNLLVDSKKKLKSYAGNQNLVDDFQNTDCLWNFPIFGSKMIKNLRNGIERRKVFDESCELLSKALPIFNLNHLVVRDTLDCLPTMDSTTFCN